ncbi:MAG: hypothetical protein GX589_06160, partial [Deltaproteobacteria bacterium]|nr:hypothetical protein [Deltaproteobacteria bacterium]
LLFVHDQEDYCNLFKEQVDLNSHLYKIDCQCTTSGHQALRMIREWRPSVVLLDAHIGDVNSFQVLDGCKGIEVAVIVTSDINSQEIEKSAEKHGACGYCHLLDDPESIEHMLKQIVNMVKAQPECFH